jgi:hypothetical protein
LKRLLLAFFTLLTCAANADTKPNGQGNWFIEGRYQASVYEGAGWNDKEADTPGTSSSKIKSTSTNSRDKLNSTGLSIGHTFNGSRTALGFTYENFGSSVWNTGQYIAFDGRTFDAAEFPMKMQNFMLELTHTYPLEDNNFILALAGFGQSIIKTCNFSKSRGGTATGCLRDYRQENISARLGVGAGTQLNQSLQIIGVLQYSDYGKSVTAVGYDPLPVGWSYFETSVNAIEASIRLRYLF